MIIVRAGNDYSLIENNFEDKDVLEAWEYQEMLVNSGYEDVQWIHLPDMNYETYIKFYMKMFKGSFK